VHPKICARQRSKRTAIIIFPVVAGGDWSRCGRRRGLVFHVVDVLWSIVW
jgi:hypothetical protein